VIPVDAAIAAAWLDPLDLMIDHRSHGMGLDMDFLLKLVERLEATPAEACDPIVVERRDGRLWIRNGRHRALAHLLAGRLRIACVIVG
jgi:hypothetical protein